MPVIRAIQPTHSSDRGTPSSPNSSGMNQPAQLIIYGPGTPTILEGTASTFPDGTIELTLPITPPPAAGTPVQIIIYGPSKPRITEGTTAIPGTDGSFDIIIGG